MRVWVTLGYFDERGDGSIFELDANDGSAREILSFDPPESLRVPHKGFTGAAWTMREGRGDLLICGSAAVYRFDGATLAHTGTLAQPSFNDLHGVTVHGDRMYVVNTGLDCVEVFEIDGKFFGSIGFEAPWLMSKRQAGAVPTHDEWTRMHNAGWAGLDATFKPEQPAGSYFHTDPELPFCKRQQLDFVHPNHAWMHEGRLFVTSLVRRSVTDVFGWREVLSTASPPHDGIVVNGEHLLTRVDGYVERRPADALGADPTVIDVTAISGVSGWCRGVYEDKDLLWVGFTEIRHRPGHMWDRGQLEKTQTAVVAMDRRTNEVVRVFDLGVEGRHSKVFSVVAPGAGR